MLKEIIMLKYVFLFFALFLLPAKANTLNIVLVADMNNSHSRLAKIFSDYLAMNISNQTKVAFRIIPGAGGINAANYLYEVAPRDGTTIGILYKAVPLIGILDQKNGNIRFDATKFNWLGSLVDGRKDAGIILTNSPYFENMTIGSDHSLANPVDFIIRNTNYRFKKIAGYKNPEEIRLAILRNEVNGIATSILGMSTYDKDWIKKYNVVLQFGNGRTRHPLLSNIPTVAESNLTREAEFALSIVENQFALIRSYVAPPNMPKDKVALLRNAFFAASHDMEFIEKSKNIGVDISPIFHDEAHDIVNKTYSAPKDILELIR